jgi:hypothetical protein
MTYLPKEATYLLNINTIQVSVDGKRHEMQMLPNWTLEKAKRWINDSYWLCAFKLQDPA